MSCTTRKLDTTRTHLPQIPSRECLYVTTSLWVKYNSVFTSALCCSGVEFAGKGHVCLQDSNDIQDVLHDQRQACESTASAFTIDCDLPFTDDQLDQDDSEIASAQRSQKHDMTATCMNPGSPWAIQDSL
jgi:hypothetical protein